jgi:hypothetical protein
LYYDLINPQNFKVLTRLEGLELSGLDVMDICAREVFTEWQCELKWLSFKVTRNQRVQHRPGVVQMLIATLPSLETLTFDAGTNIQTVSGEVVSLMADKGDACMKRVAVRCAFEERVVSLFEFVRRFSQSERLNVVQLCPYVVIGKRGVVTPARAFFDEGLI